MSIIPSASAGEPRQVAVPIDLSAPDSGLIRETAAAGGHLQLHDSTRPDVAPIVLDDFLMAVLRGEVS